MTEHHTDHVELVASAPTWITTVFTSIGGVLAAALLMWIATSQVEIVTTQAVILNNQEVQAEQLTASVEAQKQAVERLDHNFDQIWPRLRTHGENIAILTREIEELCDCKVDLKQPESVLRDELGITDPRHLR